MPKYLFTYHGGGMPDSEEEQAEHMAAWGEWMGAHGDAFLDVGNPVGAIKTVGATSVTDGAGDPTGGYSLVDAPDMDAAVAIAKGCPVVVLSGGTVEVGETFDVGM
jgi:uncharacterized protein YciI